MSDDKDLKSSQTDDQLSPTTEKETVDTTVVGEKPETVENPAVTETTPEEELEWAKLSGRTQERVRQLIRDRNEWRSRVQSPEGRASLELDYRPKSTEERLTPEQEVAVAELKRLGVSFQKETVKPEDLQAIQDRMVLDRENERLSQKYSGADGKPAYIPEEIEEYARTKKIYDLEAAYKTMFFDELVDFEKKKVTESTRPSVPYTEKPKATQREEPISAESIAERLRRPDGRAWWEKNREKILNNMGDLVGGQ